MRTGHDPDDMELVKYELAEAFSWGFPGLAGFYAAFSGMWKDCEGRLDTKRLVKKQWRVSVVYPPSGHAQNRSRFLHLKCSLLP